MNTISIIILAVFIGLQGLEILPVWWKGRLIKLDQDIKQILSQCPNGG